MRCDRMAESEQEDWPFTRSADGYHPDPRGGHSARRVIHVTRCDRVHRQQTLTQSWLHIRTSPAGKPYRDRFHLRPKTGHARKSLLRRLCLDTGVWRGPIIGAQATLIATGGASKVYLYDGPTDTSTGDGIAMAWRAGCRVANVEFVQFHPTCLYHPQAKSFLISEAVRGEGGILRLPDGTRFMPGMMPRPNWRRATWLHAIDFEMEETRCGLCVPRHCTGEPSSASISEIFTLAALNWASTSPWGPDSGCTGRATTPGGIVTASCGENRHPGLYAAGEAACTGLHGANRLASTRYSNASSLPGLQLEDDPRAAEGSISAATALGREPGHGCRRGSGHLPQLGRVASLHVGLRRHRAYDQAPAVGRNAVGS